MCVLGNEPVCGVKFWYQFLFDMISIVMVLGSFLDASLVHCIAF